MTDEVILGFTTGAAILIISSQLPKSLGVENVSGGVLNSGWQAITSPNSWQLGAILFSTATILIIFGVLIHIFYTLNPNFSIHKIKKFYNNFLEAGQKIDKIILRDLNIEIKSKHLNK